MRLPSVLSLFFATTAFAALPFKGIDWSSLLVEEKAGKQYKNSAGTVQPLETILKNTGVNAVRQRIWVNPSDGNYNLDYNIKLAKRAKAAGLKIYLDFHYSDTWADPGNQAIPAAWKSLNRDALVTQVYDYTKSVLNRFQTEGIPLSIVSIGNEITSGLLFPVGKLSNSDGPKNVAALLKSASKAVKESSLSVKPKIMIHLDNGFYWGTQVRSPFPPFSSIVNPKLTPLPAMVVRPGPRLRRRSLPLRLRHPRRILLPLLQRGRQAGFNRRLIEPNGRQVQEGSPSRRDKLAVLVPEPQVRLSCRHKVHPHLGGWAVCLAAGGCEESCGCSWRQGHRYLLLGAGVD